MLQTIFVDNDSDRGVAQRVWDEVAAIYQRDHPWSVFGGTVQIEGNYITVIAPAETLRQWEGLYPAGWVRHITHYITTGDFWECNLSKSLFELHHAA